MTGHQERARLATAVQWILGSLGRGDDFQRIVVPSNAVLLSDELGPVFREPAVVLSSSIVTPSFEFSSVPKSKRTRPSKYSIRF